MSDSCRSPEALDTYMDMSSSSLGFGSDLKTAHYHEPEVEDVEDDVDSQSEEHGVSNNEILQ